VKAEFGNFRAVEEYGELMVLIEEHL
jgi:hypothetical protein